MKLFGLIGKTCFKMLCFLKIFGQKKSSLQRCLSIPSIPSLLQLQIYNRAWPQICLYALRVSCTQPKSRFSISRLTTHQVQLSTTTSMDMTHWFQNSSVQCLSSRQTVLLLLTLEDSAQSQINIKPSLIILDSSTSYLSFFSVLFIHHTSTIL